MTLKFKLLKVALAIRDKEMVMYLILWSIRMGVRQMSLSTTSWVQIIYQSSSTYWIMLALGTFRPQLKSTQTGSGFEDQPVI